MGPIFRRAQPLAVSALIFFFFVATACLAQESSSQISPAPAAAHVGLPEDWSTQRVIYTRNGSVEDMMKVRNDPRFLNSFLLHNRREHPYQPQPDATSDFKAGQIGDQSLIDTEHPGLQPQSPGEIPLPVRVPKPPARNRHTHVDWAVSLGTQFGMAIGESPAKYTFNPTAAPTCTTSTSVGDFVVYVLKAAPATGSQANVLGLTNLYTDPAGNGYCPGTGPTFLFSYAIGSGGSLLSPVLSLDGSKIAWIENSTSGRTTQAVLHVTTWVHGQGTNATTGAVAIGNCTTGASCDVAISYTSATISGCTATADINTNSEIYVDYPSDTAFVGADNGILYHLKGIFHGTPTFDFCIPVNTSAATALSGGVYDSLLNPAEFFISDSKKIYAYTVGTSSFALKNTYTYAQGTLTGPGPLLDAFNGYIYLFSADDLAGHTSVSQLPTTLGSATVTPLGPANTNAYPILFYGTFDNNYFTNGPKNAKSTLYSCGTDPTSNGAQDLYAVSFVAATGAMNTSPVMGANTHVNPGGSNGTCSPITEFFDGSTDRIFIGMGEHLATTGANVVQMWNVTSQLQSTTSTYTAQATGYAGGASGLVVDNAANPATYPQAESVYFSTLAAGATFTTCGANNYCAVKLTQTGLQ